MWVTHIFWAKILAIFNDQNFNDTFSNDIVSFEQFLSTCITCNEKLISYIRIFVLSFMKYARNWHALTYALKSIVLVLYSILSFSLIKTWLVVIWYHVWVDGIVVYIIIKKLDNMNRSAALLNIVP